MKPVTIISPLLTQNFASKNTDSYPASIFLLTSFYSIVTVCGLIGNFLVVLIIWKNKDILGSSFGVYLFGSALTGFSFSIFCLSAYITLTPIFTEHPTGIAGEGKCKTLSAYVIVNYVEDFSMFTLTVISFERYAAVCKPLSTYAHSTTKRAKLTLCAECMISTLPILPNIIGLKYANSTTSPTIGAHCIHQLDKYGIGTVWCSLFQVIEIVLFWFSEILILFCFIKIEKTLTQQVNDVKMNGSTQLGVPQHVKRREKMLTTIIIVTVFFFVF